MSTFLHALYTQVCLVILYLGLNNIVNWMTVLAQVRNPDRSLIFLLISDVAGVRLVAPLISGCS